MTQREKGFTLIELVIVILLLFIIAGIIIAAMNKTRAKARDQQRISDLNTIAETMALYYTQNHSYPYWEVSSNKKGIFNKFTNVECPQTAPCIYDATAGSLWRDLVDSYLTNKPIPPKKGLSWQYYYDAQNDQTTPPEHYAVVTRLETSNYTINKTLSDKWYSGGYCKAPDCKPLPPNVEDGWYYTVGN